MTNDLRDTASNRIGQHLLAYWLVLALVAFCLALAWSAPPAGADRSAPLLRHVTLDAPLSALPTETTQTRFGPLTDADRDFLVKVRLAGLWEGPAGREAQQRAGSQQVKEAGQHLIDGHA